MPFTTGTAPTEDATGTFRERGYQKLFRAFRRYITGSCEFTISDPVPANTGTGVVQLFDTKPAGVAQTWTLTCTTGGANAVFSVVGSVSGAMANLTTNTNYENAHFACRIEDGGTTFVVGDNFQVVTTAGAVTGNDKWIIDAYDYFAQNGVNGAALGTPNHEIVMHGVGLAGSDAIYVGIRLSETHASSLYHWEIRGLTGFNGSLSFDLQPGISPTPIYTAFWNQSMGYWFVVNGRRFVVVAKVSTTYHALYAGFFLPYATPSEYPYPICIGAEDDLKTAYNSTSTAFSQFISPNQNGNCFWFRDVAGAWNVVSNGAQQHCTWPYAGVDFNPATWLGVLQVLPGGEYPIFPIVIYKSSATNSPLTSGNLVGTLDGCYCVTGHNNSAESLISIGGTNHVVVQNIFRTTRVDYWALKLA